MNTYTEVPILASQFPERYAELCALRDAVNAANAPIEAALAEVVSQMETLRVQAEKLAAEIDDSRGREKWIALKKEIGVLAKAMNGRR